MDVQGRTLSRSISFFRVGSNFERTFVLVIKTKLLTTYIKVYDYVESEKNGRRAFSRLFERVFKIPKKEEDFRMFKVGPGCWFFL